MTQLIKLNKDEIEYKIRTNIHYNNDDLDIKIRDDKKIITVIETEHDTKLIGWMKSQGYDLIGCHGTDLVVEMNFWCNG